MKKFLTIVLAVILAGIMALPAFAEEPAQNAGDHIVVGSTTAMTGSFFTDMWGNNTSDMDVRMLLHGYNLMQWNAEIGNYSIDDSVVSGFAVADDVNGNRTYIIALYEDNVFYEILAEELSRRDMNYPEITDENYGEILGRMDHYMTEFQHSGLDHLVLEP